jgi:hypothetical protein
MPWRRQTGEKNYTLAVRRNMLVLLVQRGGLRRL